MKLPNYKRLRVEDFNQDDKDLVNKLSLSINPGIEFLYLALNGRLTFTENFQTTIKDITLSVNVSGIPTVKTTFKLNDNSQRVIGAQVIYCQNLTNPNAYVTSAPFVSFTQTASGIQIDHVAGLIAGNVYQLRILML